GRTELDRVHKNRGDHESGFGAGRIKKTDMADVQRPHGRHQTDGLTSVAGLGDLATKNIGECDQRRLHNYFTPRAGSSICRYERRPEPLRPKAAAVSISTARAVSSWSSGATISTSANRPNPSTSSRQTSSAKPSRWRWNTRRFFRTTATGR